MVKEDSMYLLTRKELNEKSACDFEHGDVIVCGKYRIFISYFKNGDDRRMPVSFFTTVNTRDDIRDLPMSKHPQYIRNFIECYHMIRNS